LWLRPSLNTFWSYELNKVCAEQDFCTDDGICQEIAQAIFLGSEEDLYYVKAANTQGPAEPIHSFHEPVDVLKIFWRQRLTQLKNSPPNVSFSTLSSDQ